MKAKLLVVLLVMLTGITVAQQDSESEKQILLEKRIPAWVKPVIEKLGIYENYIISDTVNPFYLEADFNGDGFDDIAIRIVDKIEKKHGILIVHGQTHAYFILGAGKDFGMGSDMSWAKIWYIHRDKSIKSFTNEKQEMSLKYPAIRIVKTETISAYFYWTGKKYKTYNQLY